MEGLLCDILFKETMKCGDLSCWPSTLYTWTLVILSSIIDSNANVRICIFNYLGMIFVWIAKVVDPVFSGFPGT